jgi:hypothetical protein
MNSVIINLRKISPARLTIKNKALKRKYNYNKFFQKQPDMEFYNTHVSNRRIFLA